MYLNFDRCIPIICVNSVFIELKEKKYFNLHLEVAEKCGDKVCKIYEEECRDGECVPAPLH